MPTAASDAAALAQARAWVDAAQRIMVLTGAGVSAESGVPTFRDALTGLWARFNPEDMATEAAYRKHPRMVWDWYQERRERVLQAQPNPAHVAIAALAKRKTVTLVTQNVDGLHERAGSRRVIALHGRLDTVECLDCGARVDRAEHQLRLEALNPHWDYADGDHLRPDGDVELAEADYEWFQVPDCAACGGVLKPAVVFFGENVPRARVGEAMARLTEADLLLVVGSSLMVFS
ncbi:MAG: SIR2 family NAD-dependent protein deacylase, partial [Ralstonia sp.]